MPNRWMKENKSTVAAMHYFLINQSITGFSVEKQTRISYLDIYTLYISDAWMVLHRFEQFKYPWKST